MGLDSYSRDLTHTVSKFSPKMSLMASSSPRSMVRHASMVQVSPLPRVAVAEAPP